MKSTIGFQNFVDAFRAHGREDQFSYEAMRLIFDWYEENDPEYDLDVIGICCEWVEMENLECMEQYPDIKSVIDADGDFDDEKQDLFVQEYLEDRTTYLGATGDGHVFVQF